MQGPFLRQTGLVALLAFGAHTVDPHRASKPRAHAVFPYRVSTHFGDHNAATISVTTNVSATISATALNIKRCFYYNIVNKRTSGDHFGDLFGDHMFSVTACFRRPFRRPHVFGDRMFSATVSATTSFRRPHVSGDHFGTRSGGKFDQCV